MRILLDECLPRRLVRDLHGYSATTVPRQGWAGKKDTELISLAAEEFDIFITLDSNVVTQEVRSYRMSHVIAPCGTKDGSGHNWRPSIKRA